MSISRVRTAARLGRFSSVDNWGKEEAGQKRRLRIVSAITFVIFLIVWQTITKMGLIDALFLPSPTQIVRKGYQLLQNGQLIGDILASSRRVLIGFALAGGISVPLGIILGSSRFLRAVADPFISIIRPLPSMAWIPLSLLWIGVNEEQKYAIVFMGSFASSLLYIIEATHKIDPLLIKAARNLGASRWEVMKDVILPSALPNIISGLKVVLGISWTTVISAELVAANEGLGFLIMNGKEFFMTDQVMLGMAMISLTVVIIDVVINRIEKFLLPWRD